MFKKTTIFTLLFSILLLAGCNLGGGAPVDLEEGDTAMMEDDMVMELPEVVKLGFIGPLTGGAASYGQDIKSGIELYFTENPTIGNSMVEVIYEDGKCNGQDAANAAQKLINIDDVDVILGGVCSGETLAIAPIAESNGVLVISPGSSSPEISTAGDFIFRNYPSDYQVAKTMMDDVLANHEVVALLTEQTDYAQGYRSALNDHMTNVGKEFVMDEAFSVDNTDFRTLLTKVQENEADALIAIVQTPVVAGFVAKQAKELGMDIQIYSGDAAPGADFFDTAKDAAEGFKVVMAAEDPSRSGFDEVTSRLGDAESSVVFPLFGYDAAELVAGAIAKVGYDAAAIKDYFYEMPKFAGVASDVKFDENGDNLAPAAVKVARDGKFVLAN